MLLNNLDQAFVIALDFNWFYPSISETWMPILHRMYLPYVTIEDFFNSQITQITFPGAQSPTETQQLDLYQIQKRAGKQLDQLLSKQLTITVKTTESYISYFVARQQYAEYMKLGKYTPLYLPSIKVSLLNDGGFETVSYVYHQLTPTSLSDLSMSYAARLGSFNTFTWQFVYNYYDVWMTNEEGKREKVHSDYQIQKDAPREYIDTDKHIEESNRIMKPISTREKLKELAAQKSTNGGYLRSTIF